VSTAKKKPNSPVSTRKPVSTRGPVSSRQPVSTRSPGGRRNRLLTVLAPIVAVLVVVVVLIAVKASSDSNKPGHGTSTAPVNVAQAVTNVPAAVLDRIGAGSSQSPPSALTGAALTTGALPRVLYVGAEWCPYCAAERWPLAVALSRFGTLTGLGLTASTPNDVYPNTPTLSFHGATYSSKYLAFSGNEIENGSKQPLDTLDAADSALFVKVGGGSFPFVDIGGKYAVKGAPYLPSLLDGKTHAQIAAALADPTSSIASAIDGAANVLTAAICTTTGGQPSAVCTSAGVVAAAKALG
jgi:hypothetical protein